MKKRILLAEDDRFLRRACQTKLEQYGYEVRTAVDGEEAVAMSTETPVWDLVLLDLLMPKKDGLGVLKDLKANPSTRDVPVIILSNSSKELEMVKASTLGAIHYW